MTDYPFGHIPFNQQIQIAAGDSVLTRAQNVGQLFSFQGAFYCISFDDYTTRRGRVFHINPRSGQMTQLGNAFAKTTSAAGDEAARGAPWRLCAWNNKLWLVTNQLDGTATSAIYRIRPDSDATWTLDKDIITSYGTGIVAAFGKLYVTFMYDSGTTPKAIYERDASGTWTARNTITVAHEAGFFKPFVFDSKLFAFQTIQDDSIAFIQSSLDGTTWTTDITTADLYTLVGQYVNDARIGSIVTLKDNLYVVVIGAEPASAGYILKRIPGTSPGTWTVQKTSSAGFAGYAAVISTPT